MSGTRRKRAPVAQAMVLFQFAQKAGTKPGFERSQLSLLLEFVDRMDLLDTNRGYQLHFDTENVHVLHLGEKLLSLNAKAQTQIVRLHGRDPELRKFCGEAEKAEHLTPGVYSDDPDAWRIESETFVLDLITKVEGLSRKTARLPVSKPSRHITVEVKDHADREFIASGAMCPGYMTEPHKIAEGESTHYDHITPHALKGSNAVNNIRVLCEKCNLAKGAR